MSEDEGPLGVMLYGYDRTSSERIVEGISRTMGIRVEMLNAGGMEDSVIGDILSMGGSDDFHDSETRFLMFLGFDDESLSRSIDGFPREEGLPRPIFCCLTLENINWKLKDLLADLLEEDRYWKAKKAASIGD